MAARYLRAVCWRRCWRPVRVWPNPESSRRAFLNGRMDLTQAEAVCDLIQSRTERAAHVARAQLDGALGARGGAL